MVELYEEFTLLGIHLLDVLAVLSNLLADRHKDLVHLPNLTLLVLYKAELLVIFAGNSASRVEICSAGGARCWLLALRLRSFVSLA